MSINDKLMAWLGGEGSLNDRINTLNGRAVSATPDPVTGGIGLSAGGSLLPIPNGKGIVRVGNLSRIKAAISAATPSAPATILRIGDSTTVGAGAGTATTWTNAAIRNCSTQFAALTSGLLTADSFLGDGAVGVSPGYNVYNPNVTLGAGWDAAVNTLGGTLFAFASGAGALRFTVPVGTVKVRIYYVQGSVSVTVQTNIGVIATLNTGGGFAVAYTDYTLQPGATYIEMINANTAFYCLGMVAINATQKAVLLNAGGNGYLAAQFTDTTALHSSLNAMKAVAPSLTVIALTINDAIAPTAKAIYQSNMATIVEAALISGDVALEIGPVFNAAAATNGSLYDIRSALMDLSQSYNLSVLSTAAAFGGGFAIANSAGYMFDGYHQTYAGYGQEALHCWYPLWNLIKA